MTTQEDSLSAHTAAPPVAFPTETRSATRLHGNIGVAQLVFTVLSYNAPLGIIAGVAPLIIAFGIGIGAPILFIALGLLMALFAVGYTAMSRKLEHPGAFYSYVSAGLGRPLGLGSAFVAMASYSIAMGGILIFAGITLQGLVESFGGPSIAWWVWALAFAVIISMLGYLKIDVSAKLLGILLSLEVLIVLVWDAVVIFTRGSAGELTFSSFDPTVALGGGMAVGLIFAITCFSGFEATAVYRDEVRDPVKTVTRATYVSIVVITVFYALATWALVQAYGEEDVIGAIFANPTGAFFDSVGEYLGTVGYHIVTALLATSAFAAFTAYHNVVSRYLFSLGVDGVIHKSIGVSHPRFGSPHRASVIVSIATVLFVVIAAVLAQNPADTYAVLVGVAGYAFVLLLTLAAVGIAIYLAFASKLQLNAWTRFIAPIAAAALFIAIAVLCTVNIDLLTGDAGTSVAATVIAFGSILGGVALALIYRAARPTVYARIGRQ